MKTKLLLAIISLVCFSGINAQNMKYAESVITELSSEKYDGRGYYKKGDVKAAAYIRNEFKRMGLKSWGSFYQAFSFSVNTFPGDMKVEVDGKELRAGYDFVVREFCEGFSGTYNIFRIDTTGSASDAISEMMKLDTAKLFVAVEYYFLVRHPEFSREIQKTGISKFMFIFDEPLKWYVAGSGKIYPTKQIWITDRALGKTPKQFTAEIENRFIKKYKTNNVLAYIEGSQCPDSFYVFTAHLDHLGRHGKDVFYPGANDNASGVAMLLNLAEYYSQPGNQPRYSIAFMVFAGEETGLNGSYHYVKNPKFPLSNILYLINYDMIADNCHKVYTEMSPEAASGYAHICELNKDARWIPDFEVNELSGNSDHFPFAEQHVPAVFFLDHGDAFRIYHTPMDTLNDKSFTNFPGYFNMAVKFVNSYR